MRKYFNTPGLCYPEEHYMVDMKERLEAIRKMVDRGCCGFVRLWMKIFLTQRKS